MPSYFRARLVALLAALPLALAVQTRAHGQEPALEVFYTKLEPKEQFKYKWKGKDAVCTAGVFRWEVPESEFNAQGLDRNFTGYCAEVLVPIVADKTYRFQTNNIYAPTNYNLAGLPDDKAWEAAKRRTNYILELFGRYFRDPVAKPVNSDEAIAFQVALWEIIQETEPAMGPLQRNLFAGDFQANYPMATAPAYVLTAQKYLDSLTGTDDGLFYSNVDIRGRELIRLNGITNAEGVIAQSQFALRFRNPGVGGGAFSRALTAGGGGFGGGVPLGGGSGGGFGGGSGGGLFSNPNGNGQTFSNVPGNGTTTTTPSTTPPTTPTTTTVINEPPFVPPVPPVPPTNPVPAPAGLLLGMIALGTLGTWRAGARALKLK